MAKALLLILFLVAFVAGRPHHRRSVNKRLDHHMHFLRGVATREDYVETWRNHLEDYLMASVLPAETRLHQFTCISNVIATNKKIGKLFNCSPSNKGKGTLLTCWNTILSDAENQLCPMMQYKVVSSVLLDEMKKLADKVWTKIETSDLSTKDQYAMERAELFPWMNGLILASSYTTKNALTMLEGFYKNQVVDKWNQVKADAVKDFIHAAFVGCADESCAFSDVEQANACGYAWKDTVCQDFEFEDESL
eukprot:gnl/Spiro4/29394_TR14394_c0_g1_i1.p1 gnl/Spiro4/29394_TR14394_c0_g1~~gnl/Spiro4/29394_TR14394_c0_g1_i1.p1  ORF type:complete len:261 (-),score=56.38 gnl/Spiro4/29394_TR14394_c0_g1_i1:52-801(-)